MNPAHAPGSTVLLIRLARAVYRASTEQVLGIPLKEYSVLSQLRDNGGAIPQQALSETLHLDPNILVLLLNSIERKGLAERRRDPSDRRRHIVELTSAGTTALERAERGVESVEDEVLATLNEKERGELWRLLTKALADEAAAGAVKAPFPDRAAVAARS